MRARVEEGEDAFVFSIFLRSDSNRKNRDWLARIKFVSITTNLLRLNSTSLCFELSRKQS